MATNQTGTYSFGDVIVLIKHPLYDSTISINGFMKDSEVVVATTDPRWSIKPSGDGKSTTMERNPIKAGTIKFSLNQSTNSLSIMNAIAQYSDYSTDGADVLFEITVSDKSSGSFHISTQAVCGNPESVGYGLEEKAREFTINCGSIESNLSGSAKLSKEAARIIQALGGNVDESRIANY